jgi:hypothetical protein
MTGLTVLVACDDKSEDTADTGYTTDGAPGTEAYSFPSRFDGEESVYHAGQTFRQVLIGDMMNHIGGLTDRLHTDFYPASGDVFAELDFYYRYDADTSGMVAHGVSTLPAPVQTMYEDIGDSKLQNKIAGNDLTGQHEDWTTAMAGWGDVGSITPEGLVEHWFLMLDDASVAWSNGTLPLDPWGNPVPGVHVTADGLDLQQLLEKFLLGAVSYSQGTDDYLDDTDQGKGLLCDNTQAEGEDNFTALEHAWDEGFGYFGASRTYGSWTDDEIADSTYMDVDDDDAIDLLTEYAYGHSINAAKRDRGSSEDAPNDFTAQAWNAFMDGRTVIANASGTLTDDERMALKGHRDLAVAAWESSISSTVVHDINAVLQDMEEMQASRKNYSFGNHAKHWSEMKGFALSLQFNPRSRLSDQDFVTLHAHLRDAPVYGDVSVDDQNAYIGELMDARDMLGMAYGFDTTNLENW